MWDERWPKTSGSSSVCHHSQAQVIKNVKLRTKYSAAEKKNQPRKVVYTRHINQYVGGGVSPHTIPPFPTFCRSFGSISWASWSQASYSEEWLHSCRWSGNLQPRASPGCSLRTCMNETFITETLWGHRVSDTLNNKKQDVHTVDSALWLSYKTWCWFIICALHSLNHLGVKSAMALTGRGFPWCSGSLESYCQAGNRQRKQWWH